MASPKALREWCLLTCACYPDVEIKNMSTSFRDGLAFCAIIHKHRPDLIDFTSLSKDNVYQNNKLAFETAEIKLGIPALLDPKDMVSTKVPDSLSVITYLSQYYHFFNRKSYAGLASLRSSHVTALNNHTKAKAPDGLKSRKSLTDLETSKELISNTRPRTVCHLCFKPVHLIQRHLIDGKVYHRSCFRCKVCHKTLLPGSYTKGSDAGSLICSHHVTDSKNTPADINQQSRSTANQPRRTSQTGYFSLGGLAISSIPHYTKQTDSQDRLVSKIADMEGDEKEECNRDNRDCTVKQESNVKNPEPPPPSVADRTVEGAENAGQAASLADGEAQQEVAKTQELTELSSSCVQVTEGSSQPVSAPRRMSGSSAVPRPASRNKTSQTTSSSPAAGNSYNQNKRSPSTTHVPSRESPKVTTKHPWLTIIHPGPWTQLPPAAAPVPIARSKSVSNLQTSWCRPKVPGPNPFAEDVDEETQEEDTKPEPADQTDPSVALVLLGNVSNLGGVTNTVCTSSDPVGDTSQSSLSGLGDTGETGGLLTDVTGTAAGLHATSDEARRASLPRSLSVPAIKPANGQSSFTAVAMTEANESGQAVQVTSCKLACKENPFDRKPGMSKSKAAPSEQAPAPGHGFPLIKRKVQTDQDISTEDLQAQMNDLDKHLAALEQRGVELEKNLRDLKNDKEQEQMLMEWFSLVHERHVLLRRDTELVYLTKQQTFDERQADVEYELRCLLNKPESDWSEDDRGREQQLMDELVAIIEQRNEIISNLDQDRQREREEDLLLEDMMKNKELQKEELKEIKKSKGKFRTSKVFKMLNHKAERTKDSTDKKS
ncbi:MICAL-like protein 1 [Nibea albiflora]|uniref:MICAL-like protein 1 n=1 Tax=Nibea albiflora TaxID=240163 RepID=A0ACB7EW94_NIBAL|nr:MICAL-like protein 1 [Nibea albiflora]